MNALALYPPPSFVLSAATLRWVALAALLLASMLPDCCLNGRHFALGTQGLGPICRALQ